MNKRVGRQQLLDKAISLFRAKGYSATSIDDVVKACSIAKGSLYYHFRGKEDLALAAMASVHGYFDDHIFKLVRNRGNLGAAELKQFNDAVEQFFAAHPDGCLLANLSLEVGAVSDAYRKAIRNFFADWQSCYQSAFATRYPPGRALMLAADAVAGVQGCILMRRINGDIAPLHRQHRRLVDVMAAGTIRKRRTP